MLNRICLVGRLTDDPKLRYISPETPVANFTLAVERNYTSRDGEKKVDFIPIVVWRKQAEVCDEYLRKGRLISVSGTLRIDKNKNNGRTYINPAVDATTVDFLDAPTEKKNGDKTSEENIPATDKESGEINDDEFPIFQ